MGSLGSSNSVALLSFRMSRDKFLRNFRINIFVTFQFSFKFTHPVAKVFCNVPLSSDRLGRDSLGRFALLPLITFIVGQFLEAVPIIRAD